jgi:hypothetical protein
MRDLVESLEARARARFVRWDGRLWTEIVGGAAAALAAGLDGTVGMAGRPALESYLRLACEGVGLGYLFPAASGRDGFMNLAFLELVPRLLPAVPAARQAQVLAGLWNLGENLETAAPWLRRIFLRVFRGLADLGDLEAQVAAVEKQALAAPAEGLGPTPRAVWVWLGAEDRRFVPGALHFLAPTVVCVHDRSRPGASQGIWLAEPPLAPLALGPMGCPESPPAARGYRPPHSADARLTAAHATGRNEWRAAATLVTSQYVVGWLR